MFDAGPALSNTVQPSPKPSWLTKNFWTTHGLKVVGVLLTAAGAAVLAFTTNSVGAALHRLFVAEYQQCEVKWVPVDCPGGANDPSLGICGCEDRRSLAWFNSQLRAFKAASIPPFDGMPDDMTLTPEGAGNDGLSLQDEQTANAAWKFGIGYNAKTNEKDWCIRLYRPTKPHLTLQSPVLCLDRSGRWWSKPSDDALSSLLFRTPVKLAAR